MGKDKNGEKILVKMAKEVKVKEPNILIEAKQKFTKEEALLWLWSIAKSKFFSNGAGEKLDVDEVEERKKKGEVLYAYTVVDLNELRQKFPKVITSRKLRYYRQILKGMEKKIAFEVDLERYLRILEETGFDYLKKELKIPEKSKYFSIATIMSVALLDDGNSLQIVFTPYVVPLLLVLKKWFTLHSLDDIFELKSKYSIILYRLCREKLAFGGTFTISVEDLKHIFDLKKTKVKDLTRKFVKPAVEEINEKTSLRISFEPIRRGKGGKIVAYTFTVREIPRLPKMEEILDLERLRDIVSLLEIDDTEVETGELEGLSEEEKKIEEELKLERRAYKLLGLKRINPAVAIWYLLHFPKEKHREIWKEIVREDLNEEVKFPEKLLESRVKERKDNWDFLLGEQIKKTIVENLQALAKPYIEYLEERRKRIELNKISSEIKEIGLKLSTEEKLKIKAKVEEEFGWKGKVGELIKKTYKEKDLDTLRRILDIFTEVYTGGLFDEFDF